MEHILLYIFVAIAVSIAIFLLNRSARQKMKADENGAYNLRMSKLYGILGLIGILMGLGFLIILPATADETTSETPLLVAIALLIFWGAGIPTLLLYRNHQLVFDQETITVTNFLGSVKTMQWNEVQSIQVSMLSGLVVIYSKKSLLRVSKHLVGFSTFREFTEVKTNLTVPR